MKSHHTWQLEVLELIWRQSEVKEMKQQAEMIRADKSATRAHTYRILKPAGQGSFGTVFFAIDNANGNSVAIKRVRRFETGQMGRELQIMARVGSHENCTHLLDAFFVAEAMQVTQGEPSTTMVPLTPKVAARKQEQQHVDKPTIHTDRDKRQQIEEPETAVYQYLVMEWFPMNLHQYLGFYWRSQHCAPPPHEVVSIMRQILQAVRHLHTLVPTILHRDLKPDNVLITLSPLKVKLCDFGSAKELVSGEHNIPLVYAPRYRPIECFLGSTTYGTPADIWALGCIFCELLTGELPFQGTDDVGVLVSIYDKLGGPLPQDLVDMGVAPDVFKVPYKARQGPSAWRIADRDMRELVTRMVSLNPSRRPSADEALNHASLVVEEAIECH